MWAYTGDQRPPFAETPATGQESVWDYPRPPKLVADHRRIVVQRGDLLIADSCENYRILETAGPPTFYIPSRTVRLELLKPLPGTSICEWKGAAQHWTIETTPAREAIAWSYPKAQAPYGSKPLGINFAEIRHPAIPCAAQIIGVFRLEAVVAMQRKSPKQHRHV